METILNQITSLLVEPSGSMVYHLVIAFVFISILQPALSFLTNEHSARKRLLLGVLLLIGSRLVLFGISLVSLLGASGMSNSLGVVEIAVNALDFAIVIWLFAFRKENRTGDVGLAMFGLLILASGIVSVIFWNLQGEPGTFNHSSLALRWEIAILAILLIGLVTLFRSDAPAKVQGMLFLAIVFIGELVQIFVTPVEGDFFPVARLVHLIAFPLLSGVLQNYFTGAPEDTTAQRSYQEKVAEYQKQAAFTQEETLDLQTVEIAPTEENTEQKTAQPKTIDFEFYQTSMLLAAAKNPQDICDHFTQLTAQALLADLCLLLAPPSDNGQTALISGYDLIVQEKIPGLSISAKVIPGLTEMMDKLEPLLLLDKQDELDGLANLLYLDVIQNLMAFPVADDQGEAVAAIVMLSPYSRHRWDEHDQTYLTKAIAPINAILQKAITNQHIDVESGSLSSELEGAKTQIENLTEENETLSRQIEDLSQQLNEASSHSEEMEALRTEKETLDASLAELQAENSQLGATLEELQVENKDLAGQVTKILEQQADLDENEPISQDAQAHIDALSHANQKLAEHRAKALNQIDDLTLRINELEAISETTSQERDAYRQLNDELSERINTLKEQIEALNTQNEELLASLTVLQDEQSELAASQPERDPETLKKEAELENAIQKAAQLEHQLAEAAETLQTLTAFKTAANSSNLEEQAEVIASIAQELRQPMSSISGYTDLLISESVGILGALQKKFLERVKASIDRMNQLIDDLIQITTIDSGNYLFTLQPLELLDAIDTAIDATSTQFREKELALRVDISSKLPKLHTDKDALQQILLHLLNNAGTATPNNGEILLSAHIYEKSNNDVIRLAISDTGEGIPKEDLPRVFSRLYRADNPLIQGVGDTGVGLSIAKTLTEALGGRIWVDSELGKGSTYSVLLPTTSPAISHQEG
ncbi:hypothetical protein KQH54_01100 [bacterium]|nr:hypothetical protein [bacterium]